MIAFDLFCSNGHKFECWFKDSASFEEQKEAGILTCPICDDNQIGKAFSPFAIKRGGEKVREGLDPHQALQLIHDYLEKHFEDVGLIFTKRPSKFIPERKKRKILKEQPQPKRRLSSERKAFNSSKFRSSRRCSIEISPRLQRSASP